MIKEIIAFNYSEKWSFHESEEWFFETHAELVKKLPHLFKYSTYRTIRLPKNAHISSDPQFFRIEEMLWPDRDLYKISRESEEMKVVQEDLEDRKLGSRLSGLKRIILEKEINIMRPELSRFPEVAANELDGRPHIKSLWCFYYLKELRVEEADSWYLNHHTLLAARNFNLIRYVTYSPAKDLGISHGFVRFTELCWRDWQSMLNDYDSPRGKILMEDNKNEQGEWRSVNKTTFMDYPHVIGHQTVFI